MVSEPGRVYPYHKASHSASSLLVQSPRTNSYLRSPLLNLNNLSAEDDFDSCVVYEHNEDELLIIIRLDFIYQVDAVLMIGDHEMASTESTDLVGPYDIYVGWEH